MPFSKEAMEIIRAEEAGDLPPISESLARRMQAEADAAAVLSRPGPARDAHLRISKMSYEELEAAFPQIFYADAYDEEDAERERDPSTDPALLEDRTMETYQAMEEKDAAAWERRRRR